jgi:glycosyltransferase involved in cell wall biosynthesis
VTTPLRIGVDARELLGEVTGAGRYLGELLRRWIARPDRASRQFVLYSPRPLEMDLPRSHVEARVIPGGTGTWWEQTALRRAVRADRPAVFFAPAYTAPLALGLPFAVTIHDVSFMAHPEWFRPRERWRRRFLARRMAASASVIFTDSEFSRSEIASRLQVEDSRLIVIPPGAPAPSTRTSNGSLRASADSHGSDRSSTREPLVLYVGTLLNRRNLPELIASFAKGTDTLPDARLVIVGADRTWPPQDLTHTARAFGVEARVELHPYLSHDALQQLYARASVFVFLSEYEGFGLTPLEALTADTPIVVLDTPVAREVYGDAAEYVGIGDIIATAEAIRRFLAAPGEARDQLARAPAVLARYSWDRAADATLQQIERIAR